jgi:large subunit ribosomal protein L4
MLKIVEDYSWPMEVFPKEVNKVLISQSVRVFLANQRQGTQSAKTRADVAGSRRKIYKQKGTGGARHGDIKSPIFVGGGIIFAPKPRDYSLSMSKTMRQKALLSSLKSRLADKVIKAVSGIATVSGKTKEVATFLTENNKGKKGFLFVTNGYQKNLYLAGRNIAGLTIVPFDQINTYEVMKAKAIYWDKDITLNFSETTSKEKPTKIENKTKEKISPTKTKIVKTTKLEKKVAKKVKK